MAVAYLVLVRPMHLAVIHLLRILAQEDAPSWKRVADPVVAIAIFLGVLFVFIWQQRKGSASAKKSIERHRAHMDRVEELLERIARAIERDR